MKRSWLVLVFGLCCIAHGQTPAPTAAESPKDSAVVVLDVYDDDKNQIGNATGFLIASDRIVTAKHVLSGGSHILVNRGADGSLEASVWASDPEADIAILVVTPLEGVVPLRIAESEPRVGTPVTVVRRSEAGRVVHLDGLMFSARTTAIGGRRILATCRGAPGDSGAPLLNAAGDVVGVVAGGFVSELNWRLRAIPCGAVNGLLAGGAAQSVSDWNAAQDTKNDSVSRALLERAIAASQRARYDEALDLIEEYVRVRPKDPEGWYVSAGLCAESKDFDRLARIAEGWEAAGVRQDLMLMVKAQVAHLGGDARQAIALLERSASIRPSVMNRLALAGVRLQLEDMEGATAALREAAALDPSDPEPWEKLSSLQLRGKDFKNAAISTRTWADLEWSDLSLVALGSALEALGDGEGARKAFEEALIRDPKSARGHGSLAWWLSKHNELDKAVEHLETGHALDPKDGRLSVQLAKTYMHGKHWDKARAVLELVKGDKEDEIEALSLLAWNCHYLNDIPAKAAALDSLKSKDPYTYNRVMEKIPH